MRMRTLFCIVAVLCLLPAVSDAQYRSTFESQTEEKDDPKEVKKRIIHPTAGMETTKIGNTCFNLPENAETYKKGGLVLIERPEAYFARKTSEMNKRIEKLESALASLKNEVEALKAANAAREKEAPLGVAASRDVRSD